jgi:hypothetical protein
MIPKPTRSRNTVSRRNGSTRFKRRLDGGDTAGDAGAGDGDADADTLCTMYTCGRRADRAIAGHGGDS